MVAVVVVVEVVVYIMFKVDGCGGGRLDLVLVGVAVCL